MQNLKIDKDTLKEVIYCEKKCVDCKKCFKECPMMSNFGASAKVILSNIIKEKHVPIKLPYSCMLCNKCTEVCPKKIDLKSVFYNLRKDIFFNNKKQLKSIGYKVIKYHQIASFSSKFSTNNNNAHIKRIFIPGCSLSGYNSRIVSNVYSYLKNVFSEIELFVTCCGKPTLDVGDSLGFKKYYSKLDKILKEKKVEEVIVACPNCYTTIKRNTPGIKVKMVWEVMEEKGLPKHMKNLYKDINIRFALHDPCSIKKECNIHENVRKILEYLGVNYIEFEKNKGNTECCGYGAMVGVFNNSIALNQMKQRANSVDSEYIISYCESCVEAMVMANKKSLHVLDFIFNKDVLSKEKFSQELKLVHSKWIERYKTVKSDKRSK